MNEIIAYKSVEAVLSDLAARYRNIVFRVTTPEGMADAKGAYKEINGYSIVLEKAREKEKAESLAYGRFVDSEAKRIADPLDAIRLPIKAQIETETKRAEREREALVNAEKDRIIAEQKSLKDAEDARRAAEFAEIAKQRAELEAAKAKEESDRQARAKVERDAMEAAMKKRMDEEKAASDKIEAQERESRLRIEAQESEARKVRQAEEDRLRAERDAVAKREKAIRDEEDRVEREARQKIEEAARLKSAAEHAEKIRLANEEQARLDAERAAQRLIDEQLNARAMLELFREKFGHLPEFHSVTKAIDGLLDYFDEHHKAKAAA